VRNLAEMADGPTLYVKSAVFWGITRRRVVIVYPRRPQISSTSRWKPEIKVTLYVNLQGEVMCCVTSDNQLSLLLYKRLAPSLRLEISSGQKPANDVSNSAPSLKFKLAAVGYLAVGSNC
jgi:hypothetical protein